MRRYAGLKLGYVTGTTSHMELDASSRELFVADTGNNRVLRVMVDTGNYFMDAKVRLPPRPALLPRRILFIRLCHHAASPRFYSRRPNLPLHLLTSP